jgi:hypothetical protein
VGLKSNGTHQRLVYADEVNLLGNNTDTVTCRRYASLIRRVRVVEFISS